VLLTLLARIPILYPMVKYQEQQLDRMFAALADPTRRAVLARLNALERATVSELAEPFDMTLPAVMKHIDVLSDAGLIVRSKAGRTVTCELTAEPMESAVEWLNRYARFWSGALDRLAAYAEKEDAKWQPSPPAPSPASPSSGGSKPRRPRSTARGSNRKG
jgi:DNA-binding transcriptional ArsR family regulator